MASFTNYLRNNLIDFLLRAQTFTPPSSLWMKLCSTAPNASTAGTQISGTGYAPVEITSDDVEWAATNGDGSTTVPSTGVTGVTSNNSVIDFGTAGSSWGTASHWELWDASSGGNRLFYGTIVDGAGVASPKTISNGDPVSFPISALRLTFF